MITPGFGPGDPHDPGTPTTTDLSHLLPGGPVSVLTPTAQSGGNQVVSNESAMTAPGSQPSTPYGSVPGEVIDHEPPEVIAQHHGRTVVIRPDGSRA